MPPVLAGLATLLGTTGTAATLGAAGTLAAGGIGLGETINNLVNKPGAPSITAPTTPPSPTTPTGPTTGQTLQSSQQTGANVNASTSGFVSPAYTQAIMELINGSGKG